MWRAEEIADIAAGALARHDRRLAEEQAVYGLDALDEVGLHPILAAGFSEAGLGVLREQPYPSRWRKKTRAETEGEQEGLPLPRDRERCDLVLTPVRGQVLADSLRTTKLARTVRQQARGTLFESMAENAAVDQPVPPGQLPPEEAYWLEVKVVAQFTLSGGVLGQNTTYASQLVRGPLADLAKLSKDREILHAAMLIVLFTADGVTADHDLLALLHRCVDRDLPIAPPVNRPHPIPDRMGNTVCTAALIPLCP